MTYSGIAKIMKEKNNNLSDHVVDLLSKYFGALLDLNILKSDEELVPFIDKTVKYFKDVIYYSSSDTKLLEKLEISSQNKGTFKDGVMYINNSLTSNMQMITLFHEFTHFLQKFEVEGKEQCIGVMQDYKWRLLMEAQTQNIAEMVYGHITGDYKEEELYASEDLRMLKGGYIRSNLRNYQMYDALLKKVCILLDMSLSEFIRMNFMGKDAMKMLEDRIISMYDEDVCDFIWQVLDVIYSADAIIYTGGGELVTEPLFLPSLVDNNKRNFSAKNQLIQTEQFDRMIIYLAQSNKSMQAKLESYEFKVKKEDVLKMMALDEELTYATHLENGVEYVYKAS